MKDAPAKIALAEVGLFLARIQTGGKEKSPPEVSDARTGIARKMANS